MDIHKIDTVLSELFAHLAEERKSGKPSHFREPMLVIGEDGGRFVETIVRMSRPQRGLEIGTSSGFSALWAMRGAAEYGALKLITIDFDQAKSDWARDNFRKAGVDNHIEVLTGDGLEMAKKLQGNFDYVLLDAAKSQNLPLLQSLLPKLNPGAVVLTDNAITHASEMQDYFSFVRNHKELASGLIYIGNGIEMTVKLSHSKP